MRRRLNIKKIFSNRKKQAETVYINCPLCTGKGIANLTEYNTHFKNHV